MREFLYNLRLYGRRWREENEKMILLRCWMQFKMCERETIDITYNSAQAVMFIAVSAGVASKAYFSSDFQKANNQNVFFNKKIQVGLYILNLHNLRQIAYLLNGYKRTCYIRSFTRKQKKSQLACLLSSSYSQSRWPSQDLSCKRWLLIE